MRVTRAATTPTCAICERTLLMGERATRFAPDGREFVDVCPLCHDLAMDQGWIREGAPMTPTVSAEPRRRNLGLGTLLGARRQLAEDPVVSAPILRRLSEREQAMVRAADLFNASAYRRTIGGIGKSLGTPRASIVPLSGVNTEVVITVAWEISWYQYRVAPDSAQPVRLEERGHELDELERTFREWNATVGDDGRLLPDIDRL